MMRPAVSRDGSKLSESEGWGVSLKTEMAACRTHGGGANGPELQKEDDQEYRGHEQQRLGRVGSRREGRAGILAAFHMLRCDIMLDPVSDDAKLRDQQQQGREA